ncbi:MAG: hypothetical protein Q8O95_03215 [bacterium]|nr:hypothetical protein [bacterium]
MMSFQLSTKTMGRVHFLAVRLNISEKTLVEKAVEFYAVALKREKQLQEEMTAWDQLSDEALRNFEKNIK